jgi:hypothetical protein
MRSQSLAVDLGRATGTTDSLCNIKDDACEAVLVDVDFLVIGDLSKLATGDDMSV